MAASVAASGLPSPSAPAPTRQDDSHTGSGAALATGFVSSGAFQRVASASRGQGVLPPRSVDTTRLPGAPLSTATGTLAAPAVVATPVASYPAHGSLSFVPSPSAARPASSSGLPRAGGANDAAGAAPPVSTAASTGSAAGGIASAGSADASVASPTPASARASMALPEGSESSRGEGSGSSSVPNRPPPPPPLSSRPAPPTPSPALPSTASHSADDSTTPSRAAMRTHVSESRVRDAWVPAAAAGRPLTPLRVGPPARAHTAATPAPAGDAPNEVEGALTVDVEAASGEAQVPVVRSGSYVKRPLRMSQPERYLLPAVASSMLPRTTATIQQEAFALQVASEVQTMLQRNVAAANEAYQRALVNEAVAWENVAASAFQVCAALGLSTAIIPPLFAQRYVHTAAAASPGRTSSGQAFAGSPGAGRSSDRAGDGAPDQSGHAASRAGVGTAPVRAPGAAPAGPSSSLIAQRVERTAAMPASHSEAYVKGFRRSSVGAAVADTATDAAAAAAAAAEALTNAAASFPLAESDAATSYDDGYQPPELVGGTPARQQSRAGTRRASVSSRMGSGRPDSMFAPPGWSTDVSQHEGGVGTLRSGTMVYDEFGGRPAFTVEVGPSAYSTPAHGLRSQRLLASVSSPLLARSPLAVPGRQGAASASALASTYDAAAARRGRSSSAARTATGGAYASGGAARQRPYLKDTFEEPPEPHDRAAWLTEHKALPSTSIGLVRHLRPVGSAFPAADAGGAVSPNGLDARSPSSPLVAGGDASLAGATTAYEFSAMPPASFADARPASRAKMAATHSIYTSSSPVLPRLHGDAHFGASRGRSAGRSGAPGAPGSRPTSAAATARSGRSGAAGFPVPAASALSAFLHSSPQRAAGLEVSAATDERLPVWGAVDTTYRLDSLTAQCRVEGARGEEEGVYDGAAFEDSAAASRALAACLRAARKEALHTTRVAPLGADAINPWNVGSSVDMGGDRRTLMPAGAYMGQPLDTSTGTAVPYAGVPQYAEQPLASSTMSHRAATARRTPSRAGARKPPADAAATATGVRKQRQPGEVPHYALSTFSHSAKVGVLDELRGRLEKELKSSGAGRTLRHLDPTREALATTSAITLQTSTAPLPSRHASVSSPPTHVEAPDVSIAPSDDEAARVIVSGQAQPSPQAAPPLQHPRVAQAEKTRGAGMSGSLTPTIHTAVNMSVVADALLHTVVQWPAGTRELLASSTRPLSSHAQRQRREPSPPRKSRSPGTFYPTLSTPSPSRAEVIDSVQAMGSRDAGGSDSGDRVGSASARAPRLQQSHNQTGTGAGATPPPATPTPANASTVSGAGDATLAAPVQATATAASPGAAVESGAMDTAAGAPPTTPHAHTSAQV